MAYIQTRVLGHILWQNSELLYELESWTRSYRKNWLYDADTLRSNEITAAQLDAYLLELKSDFVLYHLEQNHPKICDGISRFPVEKILARRWFETGLMFLVQWGPPFSGQTSWQPKSDLDSCNLALYEFGKLGYQAAGGILPKHALNTTSIVIDEERDELGLQLTAPVITEYPIDLSNNSNRLTDFKCSPYHYRSASVETIHGGIPNNNNHMKNDGLDDLNVFRTSPEICHYPIDLSINSNTLSLKNPDAKSRSESVAASPMNSVSSLHTILEGLEDSQSSNAEVAPELIVIDVDLDVGSVDNLAVSETFQKYSARADDGISCNNATDTCNNDINPVPSVQIPGPSTAFRVVCPVPQRPTTTSEISPSNPATNLLPPDLHTADLPTIPNLSPPTTLENVSTQNNSPVWATTPMSPAAQDFLTTYNFPNLNPTVELENMSMPSNSIKTTQLSPDTCDFLMSHNFPNLNPRVVLENISTPNSSPIWAATPMSPGAHAFLKSRNFPNLGPKIVSENISVANNSPLWSTTLQSSLPDLARSNSLQNLPPGTASGAIEFGAVLAESGGQFQFSLGTPDYRFSPDSSDYLLDYGLPALTPSDVEILD